MDTTERRVLMKNLFRVLGAYLLGFVLVYLFLSTMGTFIRWENSFKIYEWENESRFALALLGNIFGIGASKLLTDVLDMEELCD